MPSKLGFINLTTQDTFFFVMKNNSLRDIGPKYIKHNIIEFSPATNLYVGKVIIQLEQQRTIAFTQIRQIRKVK